MSRLVLSLFPGGGMLDHAFELEGFCVVRGPDPLWGGDVRRFHPPPNRFEGVIGGDPCQSHSALANLVRAKGLEPRFPDLSGEYQRVVQEARPRWFLRENVPQAPDVDPVGYSVRSFLLDNSTLDAGDGVGHEQMRRRRFWFGERGPVCAELRKYIDFALEVLPNAEPAVAGDARAVPVTLGGSGKVKVTAVCQRSPRRRRKDLVREPSVTGRHHSNELRTTKKRGDGWVGRQPRRTLEEMLRLQGFPPDWLEHQPWTADAKRRIVGNGVPLPMGRALARAVALATPDGPEPSFVDGSSL